jgi:hypothetical protein
MTNLPEIVTRMARLLVLAALCALAGCGPGTGGTGTGPQDGLYSFGGRVGNSFGACVSVGVPCTDDCPAVSLVLEREKIELLAPCRRFVHNGTWSIDGNGAVVVQGRYELTSVAGGQTTVQTRDAVLRLRFSEGGPDSREVALTLADQAGDALLNPLTLQRGENVQGAGACSAPR